MKLLRFRAALAAALSAAALLAACDNTGNPFRPDPDTDPGENPSVADSARPAVTIVRPDTATDNVAVGDSLFVRARVTDNVALSSVKLESFAVRGSPTLGTDAVVDRFTSKTVDLRANGRTVRDTTIDRFLYATADTLPEEGVFVVVTATDTTGNTAADTVQITLGGPRISVTPSDDRYLAGTQVTLRVQASDSHDRLSSVLVTGSGAFAFERRIQFAGTRAEFDSTLVVPIPLEARGELSIAGSTVSGSNITGVAAPIAVTVDPPVADVSPPQASFQFSIPGRVEQQDSFSVQVTGVDDNRVDSVGVTVLAIRHTGAVADTLRVYSGRGAVTSGTFRFGFAALGLDPYLAHDLELQISAWARDGQGNCGSAVRENTPQNLPCGTLPGGVRLAGSTGRLLPVFVARGLTLLRPGGGTDVIADLVADSVRVYLSNFTRNRVEVLPLGGTVYGPSVAVGSQPWGLALGRTRDSLYVANSGGTNISVIPVRNAVLAEAQERRIFTVNERLFGVSYDTRTGEATSVTLHDYSDRPQFLAQASNGLLLYSTRPTTSAADGTVRIYDPFKLRSEIFTRYVDQGTAGRAIVVNARTSFHRPPGEVGVCPRRREGDTTDPECIIGYVDEVADSLVVLRALGYDTRVDLSSDIDDVGFADTTFVAASTDRRFVAVGEGVRENARIPLFEVVGGEMEMRGDVRDLISNAAERVIGLGINRDGSLGVARGDEAYFFNNELRLQGVLPSGAPTGGVALHPESASYPFGAQRLGFVSGTEAGQPYVAVINAFNFCELMRVYLRDPVTGALAVAPRAPADPANVNLRLYALTTSGVLSLTITNADLAPRPNCPT
jgi:hypothetical protein